MSFKELNVRASGKLGENKQRGNTAVTDVRLLRLSEVY